MPALTPEQLEHFETYGYLHVEHLFDPVAVIDPVMDEYDGVLDTLANELQEKGEINSTYDELGFGDRVTKVYAESGKNHQQHFDFSLPQKGIVAETPFWAGPAVFRALTDPSLLDAAECFVGPEIYSNPVQHVRVKVPESVAPRDEDGNVIFGATPWHQDIGVLTEEADDSDILTVWFPLMDTDAENGCLQVLPGSHTGQIHTHCPGAQGLQIPESVLGTEGARAVPMKRGDVLFLTKHTVHAALPNNSERIRWSFDLRYQPAGQPTGRSSFPGFVARSRSHPETELHDPQQWCAMWRDARDNLAGELDPTYNRWNSDHPACA